MKRNFIYLSLVAMMLVCSQAVSAQKNKGAFCCDSVYGIEKMATAMSHKLMLDEKTSSKFIPLYEAYLNELSQCAMCPAQKQLSDAERLQNMEKRYDEQIRRLNIKKSYVAKFSEILTPLQVEKVMYSNCNKPRGCMQKGGKKPTRGKKRPDCPMQQQNCPLK